LNLCDERATWWMFDCGEATQHQILAAPLKLGKLEHIFITHVHGDHLFGLPGLLSSRSFQGGEALLTIFGPPGVKQFVYTAMEVSHSHIKYPIQYITVEPGVIYEDKQFLVVADQLEHGVASFGYRVMEKDKIGALDAAKAKQLGVPNGPLLGKLKNGHSVTLDDQTVVTPEDVIGPPIPGRVVAILGDTRRCERARQLAEDADVLVHESTFAADEKGLAHSFFHSTCDQAAETARDAGAKKLILTHISARYQGEGEAQLLREARAVFEETYIARDHFRFEIERREPN
jgi:ribonuclease Z